MKKKQGRPPVKPAALKDGFYIEVRNKRSNDKGIKLYSETRKEMEQAVLHYLRTKDVTILGECKSNKWLSPPVEAGE